MGLAYSLGRQEAFRDGLPVGREAIGFGLLGVGMMTGQGLGPLLAGPLASWLTPGPAMAMCGALVLVSGLLLRAGRDRACRVARPDWRPALRGRDHDRAAHHRRRGRGRAALLRPVRPAHGHAARPAGRDGDGLRRARRRSATGSAASIRRRSRARTPTTSAEVFKQPPAVHRYPGSMAGRVQALAAAVQDEWGGDATAIWTRGEPDGAGGAEPAEGAARLRRPEGADLPRAARQAGAASPAPAGGRPPAPTARRATAPSPTSPTRSRCEGPRVQEGAEGRREGLTPRLPTPSGGQAGRERRAAQGRARSTPKTRNASVDAEHHQHRREPVPRRLVHPADRRRGQRGDQVPAGLHERGQRGRAPRVAADLRDDREDRGEPAALRDPAE